MLPVSCPTRHYGEVHWEELIGAGLEVALNEAYVVGLRQTAAEDAIDVLLHVSALPPAGPIDPDARRVLRLRSPSCVKLLLRRDRTAAEGYGPALPLADLAEVEAFFDSLSWVDAMYGWKFFDDPTLVMGWPRELSLTLDLRPDAAAHTFCWFSECGRGTDADTEAYCIEGNISFEDLAVLRADGTEEPLEVFIENGRRWWDAMHDHDERLSVEAQQLAQQGTPKWRTWASDVTSVSGPVCEAGSSASG
jgi:hypothetical protein